MDLSELSIIELLRLNSATIEELRHREVLTTSNAPLGDYAEWLFRKAFGWSPAGNSAKDFDAVGQDDAKYQIKARRLTERNGSRQLGAFRRLDEGNFNILAAVLFNEDFMVMRAAMIPLVIVQREAARSDGTNSWKFMLRDQVWDLPDVKDCTQELRRAQEAL